MMLTTLSMVNYCLILIFGVLLTADFGGINKTVKNRGMQFAVIFILLLVQILCWFFFGLDTTQKLYPLIVHFPLAVFLVYYYKCTWLTSFVGMLTAYLCCQIPRWFATVALHIFQSQEAYFICNTLIIFPILYLLERYVVSSVCQLLSVSKRSAMLFGVLPLLYYLFDYSATVYTNSLYSGIELAVQFMPSLVSMCYLMFAIFHYKEMQRRSNAEKESMLLAVQMNQSKKEFESLQEMQKKTVVYRHDMRHHLALLKSYLEDGEAQKAIDYISYSIADIDGITPKRYCANNTVNLILSSFAAKAKASGVVLSIDAELPQNLTLSETELCSLLSNALENAIRAASQIDDERFRTVRINCQTYKGKLMILIENNFSGMLKIENSFPQSKTEGHGFGFKSMAMIIEKHNGYFSFSAKDGIFTLKIIIPLTNKELYSVVSV